MAKRLKKVFALLLALSMTMSLLNVTAFAAGEEGQTHDSVSCTDCGGTGKDEEAADGICAVCGGSGTVDCTGSFEKTDTTATCGQAGVATYGCPVCGASYTEEEPATGAHSYENGACVVCGTEEPEAADQVKVSFDAQMPDGNTYRIEQSFDKNAGEQTIRVIDAIAGSGSVSWQSNYSIKSVSLNAYNPGAKGICYEGSSKPYEVVTGFTVEVGEEDIDAGDVVVLAGERMIYYVYNYTQDVAGNWNYDSTEMYTAVDPTGWATGWAPVLGSSFTIAPAEKEGYVANRYQPYTAFNWNGLLNSGLYTNEFVKGAAGFYPLDWTEFGIELDRETGSLRATAIVLDSNFVPTTSFYYALIRPVIYDANGGTGTMERDEYIMGDTVTARVNGFARDGYTFEGWNTEKDGSGIAYSAEETFTMGAVENVTLYAQWRANSTGGGDTPAATTYYYTVTTNYTAYDADGNVTYSATVPGTVTATGSSSYTLTSAATAQREGYTFALTSGESQTASLAGTTRANPYEFVVSYEYTQLDDGNTPTTDLPTPADPGDGSTPADPTDPAGDVTDLGDGDVPMAEAPKTGDLTGLWLAMAGVSGLGLAVVLLIQRKRTAE